MDEKNKNILYDFIVLFIEKAMDLLGSDQITNAIGKENIKQKFLKTKKTALVDALASLDKESIKRKITTIIGFLSNNFGVDLTEKTLEEIYSIQERRYSPVLANDIILPLISDNFLEKYRLQYLSKEQLEAKVIEKTKELLELNAKLEKKVSERTAELTQANKELKELDERKSEFLSIIAHQLRTPLSGIKWTLNMLIHGDLGPISKEQERYLIKSYEGNERLIAIVETMLSANRIDSAKYELDLEKNEIVNLVLEVISDNLPYAKTRNVTIHFENPDIVIPEFIFDKEKMRDVLQNLIDNAIKYSRPAGKVTITLQYTDNKVEFAIKDNGIGIPTDQQAFPVFFAATMPNRQILMATGLAYSSLRV